MSARNSHTPPAMEGGIRKELLSLVFAAVRLFSAVTRPVRIYYGAGLAINAAAMRTVTRLIGERFPGPAASIDRVLGLDAPYYAGPAQMGKPGRRLGRIIAGVLPPICPVLTCMPMVIVGKTVNWAIRHFDFVGEMLDGEFRRRQNNQKKAVKRNQIAQAQVAVNARIETRVRARLAAGVDATTASSPMLPPTVVAAPQPRLVVRRVAPARILAGRGGDTDRGL